MPRSWRFGLGGCSRVSKLPWMRAGGFIKLPVEIPYLDRLGGWNGSVYGRGFDVSLALVNFKFLQLKFYYERANYEEGGGKKKGEVKAKGFCFFLFFFGRGERPCLSSVDFRTSIFQCLIPPSELRTVTIYLSTWFSVFFFLSLSLHPSSFPHFQCPVHD